jgi:thymidylate kinase
MARSCERHVTTTIISDPKPLLVSFSGIDGAGKTTQIDMLLAWTRAAGLRTCLLRFWDDIAVAGGVRETLSHTLFKGEKGVGSPAKPVQRRDKNVHAWYMTCARLLLYFLDAVRLSLVVATSARMHAEVVVFDRYIYDQIANLDLGNAALRFYSRLLLKLVPRPDIAFVLDVDPALARARKPEYPLSFLEANRAHYLAFSKLADGITVIPPAAANDVTRIVLEDVSMALVGARRSPSCSESPLFYG